VLRFPLFPFSTVLMPRSVRGPFPETVSHLAEVGNPFRDSRSDTSSPIRVFTRKPFRSVSIGVMGPSDFLFFLFVCAPLMALPCGGLFRSFLAFAPFKRVPIFALR